MKFVKVSKHF